MVGTTTQNRIVIIEGVTPVNHVGAYERMKHVGIMDGHGRPFDMKISQIRKGHDNHTTVQRLKKHSPSQTVADVKWVNPVVVLMKARVIWRRAYVADRLF